VPDGLHQLRFMQPVPTNVRAFAAAQQIRTAGRFSNR
jgi:hypothetical protein